MLDSHSLMLFVPAMLAIAFAPGPDMLFVLAQSGTIFVALGGRVALR